MAQVEGPISSYPARALCLWYVGLVIIGTALLSQPVSRGADVEEPVTVIQAMFTATSASCVTGLSVRATSEFSLFGQIVILLLIQLGGIGIMTVATFVTLSFTGRSNFHQRRLIIETLGSRGKDDLRIVLGRVVAFTFILEGVGAAVLFLRFCFDMPFLEAVWHAVFHSISAFCNAGFALHPQSIEPYRASLVVNVAVMTLVVVGGIGFPVMMDVRRNGRKPWREGWDGLALNSKLMLIGTIGLVLVGATAMFVLESNNSMRDMGLGERILVSSFHSVSTRTAGFSSVELSELTEATLFVFVLLMLVGAGPCSTGGGFKVSTFMVLAIHAYSRLTGRRNTAAFRRGVSQDNADRAASTVLIFAVLGSLALAGLLIVNGLPQSEKESPTFLDATFEVVSALATVGLSTGYTNHLNTAGELLVSALMFMGRVGPLTLFVVLSARGRDSKLQYPNEEVLIG